MARAAKRPVRRRAKRAPPAAVAARAIETTRNHVAMAGEYAASVASGEIVAGRLARAACVRQLEDLERSRTDPTWPYEFSPQLAGRPCRFIEALPHVKGALAGKPLRLEPWQAFVLTSVFGWVRRGTNQRRFRRATIFVPRGNGKSTLSSPVALYCLSADGESGAEVYSAATTREQARIVWGDARAMLNRAPLGTRLRERLGVVAPTAPTASSIFQPATGSAFKPLSRDADNLDGLNIHAAVIDEIHAHKTREVYDVVETGTAKRDRSLLWVISTAGSDISGIGYEVFADARRVLEGGVKDDSLFAAIWSADEGDDWTDEATWRKANPNWETSVQPEVIGQLARKAMRIASARSAFLTKHLNLWVNADQAWVSIDAFRACGDAALNREDFAGEPCWMGLDLASKIDIAARALVFRRALPHRDAALAAEGRTELHIYLFLDAYLPSQAVVDGRNSQYAGWADTGRIKATPGDVLDFDTIREDIVEDSRRYDLREIDYDPWQATQLAQDLSNAGLLAVEVRPSVQNFSAPMKELEALIASGLLHHDANPVLEWMASNVVCHRDAKDNIYPRKERPENKIDGIVASLMALGRALLSPAEDGPYSASRGLRFLP